MVEQFTYLIFVITGSPSPTAEVRSNMDGSTFFYMSNINATSEPKEQKQLRPTRIKG